jgi:peptidoglycan/LPS O-acetylase OafA/YrhL
MSHLKVIFPGEERLMNQKNISMPSQLSGLLDFVRWVAALLVVLQHVRYLWCVEYTNVQNKTLLIKFFYFITGFGSEAVLVFFVLSGYLVGGGALRKWREGKYSSRDYLISRFSRIYTVLLPALIFGGLLDWIGLQYFNASEIYTNSPSLHTKLLDFYISNNLGWEIFFGNLAHLQGMLTSHFGSNGPLWSLAYEWWYYCLFGLILEVLNRKSSELIFWFLVAVLLLAIAVLPTNLLLYMVIWGFGVWVAMLDPVRLKFPLYVGGSIFILVLIGSRISHIALDGSVTNILGSMLIRCVRDLSLAAGFSLLILSLQSQSLYSIRTLMFHKLMADFSFTIYLMHVPLLVFMTAMLNSEFDVQFFAQPTAQALLLSTVILLMIYGMLFLFSRVTEKNTPHVKAYLVKLTARFRQSKQTEIA